MVRQTRSVPGFMDHVPMVPEVKITRPSIYRH